MTRIKICGITNLHDALVAVELGADALGFVFADSPRRISPVVAREIMLSLPPFVNRVGVFVNENKETVKEIFDYCMLNTLQFHGEEDDDYLKSFSCPIIKAFRVKDKRTLDRIRAYGLPHFLLDAYDANLRGGTGKSFDWAVAREAAKLGKVILSGGLNYANVRTALDSVRPYAVDVSSSVECSPGKKDQVKLRTFIQEVRSWDSEVQ